MTTISNLIATLVVLSVLVSHASAASYLWVDYIGDHQFTTQNNWYPQGVPGPNDDVTFNNGTMQITIPTGINSIVMGTSVDAPATLNLYHQFAVGNGGFQVKANGVVTVDSGNETITGTVAIDGQLIFNSGVISGVWSVSNRGSASFPGGAARTISAGSLTTAGTLSISGVVILSNGAKLIANAAVNGTGLLQINGDATTTFNTAGGTFTYTGAGNNLTFYTGTATIGAFTFTSGDVLIFSQVSFTQAIVIPAGSSLVTLGAGNVTLPNLSGGGDVVASSQITNFAGISGLNAIFVQGAYTYFTQQATVGSLSVMGGNVYFSGDIQATNVDLQGGILQGSGSLTGASVSIESLGVNIGTKLVIGSTGTVKTASVVIIGSNGPQGQIVVNSGATLNVQAQLNATGPTGNSGITNNGAITASSTFNLQNVNLVGTGSVTISGSGAVNANTCSVSQSAITVPTTGAFNAYMTVLTFPVVNAAPSTNNVQITIGQYTFTCVGSCKNVTTKTASPDIVQFLSVSP